MVKLLMSWDILDDQESDYFEFIVREWLPGITRLGLQPTEAWFTQYGECPQVLTGGIAETYDAIQTMLDSDEWAELHAQLLDYVTNYQQKIVRASGPLQIF